MATMPDPFDLRTAVGIEMAQETINPLKSISIEILNPV
jgi:hypothetical protein